MDWLPSASRTGNSRTLSWSETTDPKGVLHTTETSGWPSYKDWTVNPHATIMPNPGKGITIHQHVPFSSASFALRNLTGGVQTNRDYAFQFELIGTSEKNGPGYFWAEADDIVLLAVWDEVIYPTSHAVGIPLRALPFQSYPASYGVRGESNTVRLSGAQWDTYTGWCGHQHVPENVHGDPGAFPWTRMVQLVNERDNTLKLDREDQLWLTAMVNQQITELLTTPFPLGGFAAGVLVTEDGKPRQTGTLKDLVQWGAAGAVSANRLLTPPPARETEK